MDLRHLIQRPRRRPSPNRKSLIIGTVEGFPATIIAHMIGGPFLTAYLLYLGATSDQVGLVLAIPPLANVIQIVIAMYMNRFENRRKALIIFSGTHRFLWVLTGLIPFVFPNEAWVLSYIIIYLFSFLFGAAGGVVWSSLISDFVPAQVRGRYFGIRNSLLWGSASISLLIGGQILERFNESIAFGILYIISAICVVWNVWMLIKFPNPPMERSLETDKFKKIAIPFKDSSFIRTVSFIAIFILLQNTAVPLFAFVMLDILNVSYQSISMITTVHLIVMMISFYYWGNLNARFATRRLIFWTLPILSLSCILWLGISVLPVLFILYLVHILLGIGIGGSNLLLFNYIIGDTPKPDRPMYIAVFHSLTGITGFIGPLLGGYIFKLIEEMPMWIQSYGVFTAVGLLMLLLTVFGINIFKDQKNV